MKKYLTASLLAACLTVPAFASTSKLAARSPDEPLHRSAVALCIGLFVALHAYKRRLKREELLLAALKR